MFECGPRAPILPDQEARKKIDDYTLFMNYYDPAWKWGERCDKKLHEVGETLKKQLQNRAEKSR
jgi:hypothetical protein